MATPTDQGAGVRVHKLPRRAYWRAAVLTRADLVVCQMSAFSDQYGVKVPQESRRTFEELIREARGSAGQTKMRTGNRSNHAWLHLHAAEVLAAQYIPEPAAPLFTERALSRLQTTLKPGDPRRQALEEELNTDHADLGGRREHADQGTDARDRAGAINGASPKALAISEAFRVAYSEQDEQYARIRNFRNVLFSCFVSLVIFSLALALVGGWNANAIPLCFDSTEADGGLACPLGASASGWDVTLVGFLGSLGGALAAVFAIRQMQGTTAPYAIPLNLALLKLPLGAITAIVGLLFINGEFVPGMSALDTSGQILAYAVVLGYAQQIVTRLLDRQGRQVLEAVPSKSEPVVPTAPPGEAQGKRNPTERARVGSSASGQPPPSRAEAAPTDGRAGGNDVPE